MKWVAAIIITIALIVIWQWHEPVVYVGDPGRPMVTILAGTHGNEPAPAQYLTALCARRGTAQFPDDVRFAFVPRVNPVALMLGQRHVPGGTDMNRIWPDAEGRFTSPYLALIDSSTLVVDFHESWGVERYTPGSLGATIYTNRTALVPLTTRLARELTTLTGDPWQAIQSLPTLPEGHALDEYCVARGIAYILIEVPGQADFRPREQRERVCAHALHRLLGIKK